MSAPKTIPPAVTERQIAASDPAASAWVSANAGSGKTHVLAQRVVRLLLDGVDPARILCITFTKAAAANMANRVFQDLRAWTLLDDAGLDEAIRKAGVRAVDAAMRTRARQLFATALDTHGGLRVQTIHAFCTQLLHLFPFEANVPARFKVLDESAEARILERLGLDVLLQAAERPDSELGRALERAVLAAADRTFQDILREAIRARDALTRWVEEAGGTAQAVAQLSHMLEVRPDDTVAHIDADIVGRSAIRRSEWAEIAAVMLGGSKTDIGQGERFQALATLQGADLIETYLDIFCTKARDKTKERVATTAIERADPDLCARLNEERERVWRLVQNKRAVEARDRSAALVTIAHAVIARFREEKNRRGLLDYDDLIDKTLALLRDQRAAWVHYKLDRGIHHVLIDEAQDTSPKQWEIVRALVGEFFAGRGAHERRRTIFAVGDEKQSIFSFQGAAPREFANMRRHFEETHTRARLRFVTTEFKASFRSGPVVLGAVDTVFARVEAYQGLAADPVPPLHEALPDMAPGLVELWELESSDSFEQKEGWAAPFDVQSLTSATAKLAQRVARNVAVWRSRGRRPKDVLILLRRRGALFDAIIRALKNERIPVAGADRLVLTEHIAVMDLMALADAILLPEDDLALATVLKSPLFGLDETALFDIAWQRNGPLRAALARKRPEIAAELDSMRNAARGMSPFAFYAWLLGARQGRRKMFARLGHEAADALDEFVNLALDYERIEMPSLQGFVAWLRGAEAEVKRDMEMDRDEVRVMTVHGAKGLEAPIVVLADTTTPAEGWHPPRLLNVLPERAVPGTAARMIWANAKRDDVGPMAAAREAALQSAREEYRRLLYVAMTRAAERLIVCGTQGKDDKIPKDCWYELIRAALDEHCLRETGDDGNEVLRLRKGEPEPQPAADGGEAPAAPAAPAWLSRAAPADKAAALVTPSETAALRRPHAPASRNALLRGTLTHRLMQALPEIPPERRAQAARDFLARAATGLSADERAEIAGRALRVIAHSTFSPLFAPGSHAEVPIVGRLTLAGRPVRVSGQIDRLVVAEDAVLIADFKTDRAPPSRIADVPEPYIRQLALYRAVLARLYPGRPVRTALVWTEAPELMELSSAVLDEILARPVNPA
jgi:ATP-dependent helicase/nuclease subunit A